jgi:DNA-directed RNA polymerase specialized sigma24 family protein
MDDQFQVMGGGKEGARPEASGCPYPQPGSGPEPTSGSAVDRAPVDATFLAAYERYRGPLLVWLRSRMRDSTAAEDCCQEVYARLLSEMRAGRCPDVPAAWLQRVAQGLVVKRASHPPAVPHKAPSTMPSSAAGPTAFIILCREAWDQVWCALQGASRDDRSKPPNRATTMT